MKNEKTTNRFVKSRKKSILGGVVGFLVGIILLPFVFGLLVSVVTAITPGHNPSIVIMVCTTVVGLVGSVGGFCYLGWHIGQKLDEKKYLFPDWPESQPAETKEAEYIVIGQNSTEKIVPEASKQEATEKILSEDEKKRIVLRNELNKCFGELREARIRGFCENVDGIDGQISELQRAILCRLNFWNSDSLWAGLDCVSGSGNMDAIPAVQDWMNHFSKEDTVLSYALNLKTGEIQRILSTQPGTGMRSMERSTILTPEKFYNDAIIGGFFGCFQKMKNEDDWKKVLSHPVIQAYVDAYDRYEAYQKK